MIIFQGCKRRNCHPTRTIQISSVRIKYFETHITITVEAFRYQRLKGSSKRLTVLIYPYSNFLVNIARVAFTVFQLIISIKHI